jgi:cell division protein FtsW (lipid II flippase)
MRPISVLNLIILGSCIAISICLIAVWGLLMLSSRNPEIELRVASELKQLPKHIAIFIPMTLVAAMSFFETLKLSKSWRVWQLFMWASLFAIGFYYVSQV